MGIENPGSNRGFTSTQKEVVEQREEFAASYTERAEMRNKIEKAKQTLWQKMKFWQSAPGVTMMDVAHEEALAMNDDVDRLVAVSQSEEEDLGELRQATADYLGETKYDLKSPEQIRAEEYFLSLKIDVSEKLAEDDLAGAAELVRSGYEINGDTHTAVISKEGKAELDGLFREKLATYIKDGNIDGLHDFLDADQDNLGSLGDIRGMDLLNLPGVTPEMLKTPEVKEFLQDIVVTQLEQYKNSDNLDISQLDAVRSWKQVWVENGYLTEAELQALPIFKRIAVNDIKSYAKLAKSGKSNVGPDGMRAVFDEKVQNWMELGAITEEDAGILKRTHGNW